MIGREWVEGKDGVGYGRGGTGLEVEGMVGGRVGCVIFLQLSFRFVPTHACAHALTPTSRCPS